MSGYRIEFILILKISKIWVFHIIRVALRKLWWLLCTEKNIKMIDHLLFHWLTLCCKNITNKFIREKKIRILNCLGFRSIFRFKLRQWLHFRSYYKSECNLTKTIIFWSFMITFSTPWYICHSVCLQMFFYLFVGHWLLGLCKNCFEPK